MKVPNQKNKKGRKPRPAFRITPTGNPHDIDSVEWTVQRYGAITEETKKELCAILDKHSDQYEYSVFLEGVVQFVGGEPATPHYVFKCSRKNSVIEKYLDNEQDARQTIENFKKQSNQKSP